MWDSNILKSAIVKGKKFLMDFGLGMLCKQEEHCSEYLDWNTAHSICLFSLFGRIVTLNVTNVPTAPNKIEPTQNFQKCF